MSSKLVTDRKERIALMSDWARRETEFKIKHFEGLSEKQPEYKTMYGFDQVEISPA
jgi:hypothetical protein